MRFWRIEICHITDIYEKQKDYSVLKNEEKYMIEKVYDDNMLSFKEKGLYTAIYLNETMNVDQLVESGKDKADAVRSGLKKLIEKQYIKYKSYNYPVAIIIYHIHGITFLQALSMTVI